MSLFHPSSESAKHVHDKILLWGPPGSGKTHCALTWPEPALIDVETRGAHFADRVSFAHAEPQSIEEIQEVLKELRSGALPCQTFVFDSYSAVYEKLTVAHTKQTPKGDYVTDYVTVNKRIATFREFAFSVARRNVIFIAHQTEKYDRQGNVFTKRGIDFVGDDKFRFAFDFIFRLQPNGKDPSKTPATFHIEKSASPHLAVGQEIRGLDYAKFLALTRKKELRGEALADAQTRESHVDHSRDDEPVGPDEVAAVERARAGIDPREFIDIVVAVTGSGSDYKKTSIGKARQIIARLRDIRKGAA